MVDKNGTILIIDDDPSMREILHLFLAREGHHCEEAEDGATALDKLTEIQADLVLLDVQMPGLNGLETLKRLKPSVPDTPVIMVTSVDELETVRTSLRHGVYDYLLKPVSFEELIPIVENALDHYRLIKEREAHRENLERMVQERTRELQAALDHLNATYRATIRALGSALETRDMETEEHSVRVAHYTLLLCRTLGITSTERLTDIERGAYLHDIGKIGVPDRILLKPGHLDDEEWQIVKMHPDMGAQLLSKIDFLSGSIPLVQNHHERWDGGGYPGGLRAESIPVEARAFAVADTLDAITSDRPYREGRPMQAAREIIQEESGRQFDPAIVAAFQNISDQALREVEIELVQRSEK